MLERKLALLETQVRTLRHVSMGVGSACELNPPELIFLSPVLVCRSSRCRRKAAVVGAGRVLFFVALCTIMRKRKFGAVQVTSLQCLCGGAGARNGALASENGDERIRGAHGHEHLVRVERQRRNGPDALAQEAVVVSDGRQ